MVCAELYAQWNNIVIGASGVAWRGVAREFYVRGTRLSSMHFGGLVNSDRQFRLLIVSDSYEAPCHCGMGRIQRKRVKKAEAFMCWAR
jgi:hypothetical protein